MSEHEEGRFSGKMDVKAYTERLYRIAGVLSIAGEHLEGLAAGMRVFESRCDTAPGQDFMASLIRDIEKSMLEKFDDAMMLLLKVAHAAEAAGGVIGSDETLYAEIQAFLQKNIVLEKVELGETEIREFERECAGADKPVDKSVTDA